MSCEHFQPIHIEFQQYLLSKLMVLAAREWHSAAAVDAVRGTSMSVTTANHGRSFGSHRKSSSSCGSNTCVIYRHLPSHVDFYIRILP